MGWIPTDAWNLNNRANSIPPQQKPGRFELWTVFDDRDGPEFMSILIGADTSEKALKLAEEKIAQYLAHLRQQLEAQINQIDNQHQHLDKQPNLF